MEKDMTVGNPTKMILDFTVPLFIGNVFQQLYNMADTIIVGKFVGANALAAVGSTGTIMFLIIGFLQGMTAGFTVPTAQKFGAGDMKSVRKTVGSAAILSFIVSAIMTVISMCGMKWLLHFMNTPDNIFDDAYRYIMVICAGIFAQVLYNLLASILRALGNSKTPLYFLILAAVLNIVLDLVFIIVFHMGAAGAAYATVISQGISVFYYSGWRNDDAVCFEYSGICGDCRIYSGQQDRTAGDTGICGVGYHDGDVLCTEYGGRKDSQNPTGISKCNMDGICIRSCDRSICNVCREISDPIVFVRKSEPDYGLCRHLSKVCGTVFYSTDIGQCVPKWDTGNGIWSVANDGRCCGVDWKRCGCDQGCTV